VTDVDSTNYRTVVVRLDGSLHHEGKETNLIKASTRHVGDKFEAVGRGNVFCNIILLIDDETGVGDITIPPSFDKRLLFIGNILWSPSQKG
jgi:hypothetical protein